VIRPGNGSTPNLSGFWAFCLVWNAKTGRTIAILDGVSDGDIGDLKAHLACAAPWLQHPLTCPEILLHMITSYYNLRIRNPDEQTLFDLEWKTGLSRIQPQPGVKVNKVWDWTFQQFQEATQMSNRFNTTATYLTRRFVYSIQLTKTYLSVLDLLKDTYHFEDPKVKEMLQTADWRHREECLNNIALLENYEHDIICMGKRNENLITVVRLSCLLYGVDR
jgi:hypothetical protein